MTLFISLFISTPGALGAEKIKENKRKQKKTKENKRKQKKQKKTKENNPKP